MNVGSLYLQRIYYSAYIMARPEKNRKIYSPPLMKGYRPFGICAYKSESLKLSFEEYESIRLVNYEILPQEQAAEMMNISRPTLTRIYNKALKTITQAFVEGKAIHIEGGSYEFEKEWYKCKKCHKVIQGIENHIKCNNCTDYNLNELIKLNR